MRPVGCSSLTFSTMYIIGLDRLWIDTALSRWKNLTRLYHPSPARIRLNMCIGQPRSVRGPRTRARGPRPVQRHSRASAMHERICMGDLTMCHRGRIYMRFGSKNKHRTAGWHNILSKRSVGCCLNWRGSLWDPEKLLPDLFGFNIGQTALHTYIISVVYILNTGTCWWLSQFYFSIVYSHNLLLNFRQFHGRTPLNKKVNTSEGNSRIWPTDLYIFVDCHCCMVIPICIEIESSESAIFYRNPDLWWRCHVLTLSWCHVDRNERHEF